jgi:hypothetical protein
MVTKHKRLRVCDWCSVPVDSKRTGELHLCRKCRFKFFSLIWDVLSFSLEDLEADFTVVDL